MGLLCRSRLLSRTETRRLSRSMGALSQAISREGRSRRVVMLICLFGGRDRLWPCAHGLNALLRSTE
eukprot:scaffold79434_cov32-Tisochrysis_lutea.AAC.1